MYTIDLIRVSWKARGPFGKLVFVQLWYNERRAKRDNENKNAKPPTHCSKIGHSHSPYGPYEILRTSGKKTFSLGTLLCQFPDDSREVTDLFCHHPCECALPRFGWTLSHFPEIKDTNKSSWNLKLCPLLWRTFSMKHFRYNHIALIWSLSELSEIQSMSFPGLIMVTSDIGQIL